jgi:hypothetical protein
MPQPNDLSRSLVALDHNSTIVAVVELSQSSWLVGARSWSRAQNGYLRCCIAGGMRRDFAEMTFHSQHRALERYSHEAPRLALGDSRNGASSPIR